jgi:hypothetical protein
LLFIQLKSQPVNQRPFGGRKVFMKYVFLLSTLSFTACSSFEPPNVTLETDKQAYHMTRAQVILGINECEDAGTRPVVITAKRRINGVTTDVPVEVTCNPRYRIFQ